MRAYYNQPECAVSFSYLVAFESQLKMLCDSYASTAKQGETVSTIRRINPIQQMNQSTHPYLTRAFLKIFFLFWNRILSRNNPKRQKFFMTQLLLINLIFWLFFQRNHPPQVDVRPGQCLQRGLFAFLRSFYRKITGRNVVESSNWRNAVPVRTINSRVNRMTRVAPNKVSKKPVSKIVS